MFKLVYFKQKLVYLKCILFFPSCPFNFLSGKPVLKVNILPLLYLANNSERSDLIKNQCYEALLLHFIFFFVKHCCLFQSKEARHAPLVWPGVEQLMILRHTLKPYYSLRDDDTDLKNPGAIGRWTQTAEELAMQSRLEIERNLKNNIPTYGWKSMLFYSGTQ